MVGVMAMARVSVNISIEWQFMVLLFCHVCTFAAFLWACEDVLPFYMMLLMKL